jgi:hypothetical protein
MLYMLSGRMKASQAVIRLEDKKNPDTVYTKVLQKERDLYLPAIQALKGKGPMRLDDMLKAVEKKSKELLQENAAKAPKEMRP